MRRSHSPSTVLNVYSTHLRLTHWQLASRAYSGGMRRRLSVACSLIADPRVLFLDEPTTGMDPVHRRGVWDVLERCSIVQHSSGAACTPSPAHLRPPFPHVTKRHRHAASCPLYLRCKQDRVVVLTTHAMEEADTLGDVISIMSRGRLHCLGTPLRLKTKYGTGYTVELTAPEAERDSVLGQVRSFVPAAVASGPRGIVAIVSMVLVDKLLPPLCAALESDEMQSRGVTLAVSL